MKKLEKLYEGKAKKIYKTENSEEIIVSYKDAATAFNGKKIGTIAGKGAINNRLSNHFMKIIEKAGIKTHLIEELSDTETLVRKLDIFPLEVIVRNLAAGSFAKRFGVEEGKILARPSLEYSLKNDELNDPLINSFHVLSLNLATEDELEKINKTSFEVNEILSRYLLKFKVKLVDFKLEFGRTSDGTIILADEISPDTCRLWDIATNEKLDKDRFRNNLSMQSYGYEEMMRRIFNS